MLFAAGVRKQPGAKPVGIDFLNQTLGKKDITNEKADLAVIDSIWIVMLIYASSREKYLFEPFFRVIQHVLVLHPIFQSNSSTFLLMVYFMCSSSS